MGEGECGPLTAVSNTPQRWMQVCVREQRAQTHSDSVHDGEMNDGELAMP